MGRAGSAQGHTPREEDTRTDSSGQAESGPGARVEAGPTPQRVGGGGPRRECRAVGSGRGSPGPAPAQVANGRGGAG